MSIDSVDLVRILAADTARIADQSGEGLSETAASAMIEIIGQVRTSVACPSVIRDIHKHGCSEKSVPNKQER